MRIDEVAGLVIVKGTCQRFRRGKAFKLKILEFSMPQRSCEDISCSLNRDASKAILAQFCS